MSDLFLRRLRGLPGIPNDHTAIHSNVKSNLTLVWKTGWAGRSADYQTCFCIHHLKATGMEKCPPAGLERHPTSPEDQVFLVKSAVSKNGGRPGWAPDVNWSSIQRGRTENVLHLFLHSTCCRSCSNTCKQVLVSFDSFESLLSDASCPENSMITVR